MKVDNSMFLDFLHCPYKAHLRLSGRKGKPSEYETIQDELSRKFREQAVKSLLKSDKGRHTCQSPDSLSYSMRAGYSLIVDSSSEDGSLCPHFDALRKVPYRDEYSPILFVHSEKVSANDKLLLAFLGLCLGRLQKTGSQSGRIIFGSQFKISKFYFGPLIKKARRALGEIEKIQNGSSVPPLILNKHCAICEFQEECRTRAVEKNDLSLLKGLTLKDIKRENKRGIFTVSQYSYTFRPRKQRKRMNNTNTRRYHSLQALAIRENKVYVAQLPEMPFAPVRIYLDVEGIPDKEFHYLIGLLISDGSSQNRFSLWANDEAKEQAIWATFLEMVGSFNNFLVFHYGRYESQFIKKMSQRYPTSGDLAESVGSACVNVLSAIYANIYFPSYSNSLKDIAAVLGFKWSMEKERLIKYNQDDCSALECVVDAIYALQDKDRSPADVIRKDLAYTADIKPERLFGRITFFLPELEFINQRSYYTYQRAKVLPRTNQNLQKALRRGIRAKTKTTKVTTIVTCEHPKFCPYCGYDFVYKHAWDSKKVVDVKADRKGVRRRITKYVTHRCRCKRCNRTFYPAIFREHSGRYGRGLRNWVVYQSIGLKQSDKNIVRGVQDIFDILVSTTMISQSRQLLSDFYQPTYDSIRKRIVDGNLVHVDETKISIQGSPDYVWVFTNTEDVMYVYSQSRDGSILHETLSDFKGVLISDFYSAYDSIECPQQRCLIHLIRDLNDDLSKNPFDNDLKALVQDFANLLKPIVEAIDRFGLRKRHFGPYKRKAEDFITRIVSAEYNSENAIKYQSRFRKNKDKLFTFLDYNGVPWNNNNAENAIKGFATLRRVIGGCSTEKGIVRYLKLLSIYQTLRARNASFWKFLVSGEVNIDRFIDRRTL
jgi:predicted RecB family nuclease